VEAKRFAGCPAGGPALDAENGDGMPGQRAAQRVSEPADGRMILDDEDLLERLDELRKPGGIDSVQPGHVDDLDPVAERAIDAAPPAGRAGFAATMGSTRAAKRWAFASGEADSIWDEWVVVQNPGLRPVRVSFTALAGGQRLAVEGLQDLLLAPGQRGAFRLGDHLKRFDLPLVVTASQPVVVERDLYLVKGLGTQLSMGLLLGPS